MLNRIEMPNSDITAFEVVGKLTKEDYTEILTPLFIKTRNSEKKLKFLLHFGKAFKGLTTGALLEDFKVGLHNVGTFEKMAVVSDRSWITKTTSFLGSLISTSVKTFDDDEIPSAIEWLKSGEQNFPYAINDETGVLSIEVDHPLTSDQFSSMARTVDEWIDTHGKLKGLVVQMKRFPGWRDLGSLFSHIQFVKGHHKKIYRVALCADDKLTILIPMLAQSFVKAQVRHFPFDEVDEAKKWAAKSVRT